MRNLEMNGIIEHLGGNGKRKKNFTAEKYKSKKVLETNQMDSIVKCGAEHTSKETMTENF